MTEPGHNGGPPLEAPSGWHRHCWKTAREALLPVLPIEVLRLRVKRAAELGLDYRTYASFRAQTGHDVVAFLFSSNALRVAPTRPAAPAVIRAKLQDLPAQRLGLASAPLTPGLLVAANPLDSAHKAPWALAAWGEQRRSIRAALGKLPGDGVMLVGDHGLEAEWCAAARLGGYLPAERFFGG